MAKAFLPLFLLLSCAMIVLLQFGFIFLLLALLPTVVAFYYDIAHDQKTKSTFKTVFACNLAATLPSLAPMLEAGVRFRHYDTSAILNDWNNWLLVYSGAAAGWCLIHLCRYAARFTVMLFYEYNIALLEGQQNRLADEWGQQIKYPPGTVR